ncbi:5'-3' exonuclease family protein [Artemisia annua]|uniref:Exonuclease 1 n=1 Tax=Artemisia annua TaxID=35608 RepID=A0A2U1MM13_ARTAN|nr:5'-3' exonuclease family protein [Artemisia annua]
MAHQLIQILESDNIEFVVAPYEADAQLAYLSSLEEDKGGIAAVISEDSDLLAYGCSSRAVSITPSMAHQLIQILESDNIEFVVAPYEADAQLAYLSSLEEDKGGIAAVISEDSDLLAYGCSSVVFMMDRYGNGEIALRLLIVECGVDSSSLSPQTFAMSFAPMNGIAGTISSMAQNHAMFKSLSESLRQTYHHMLAAPAGAASVHHSQQKKDFRISEEASRAVAGHDSSNADDDRNG